MSIFQRFKPLSMKQPAKQLVISTKLPILPPPPPPPKTVIVQPSPMIAIEIRTVNSLVKTTTVNKNMTGMQLKQHIFDHLSQELEPNTMSIYYEGVKITNNMKLAEINIVVGHQLKIIQQKADLIEVVSAIVNANGIDPITDEVGTAKMPCGHHIGKDCMTALIKSLISSSKYQIRCPYVNEDAEPCRALWDFAMCRKIGVLTKTEVQTFQNCFTQTWLKKYAKTCPCCKYSISKFTVSSKYREGNRVICPKCKYGDFCFLCLNKWTSSSREFCGNEQCKFPDDFLSKAPWTRKFMLIDTSDGKIKEYCTPKYRACIHCQSIIECITGDKHMLCMICKKSFCWICLAAPVNGKFPCESYKEYCGKTAQAQKFNK